MSPARRWKFGRAQAAPSSRRRIVGRQLGGELGEPGRRGSRPARGRMFGGGIQLGDYERVGAFGGERQVPSPLL